MNSRQAIRAIALAIVGSFAVSVVYSNAAPELLEVEVKAFGSDSTLDIGASPSCITIKVNKAGNTSTKFIDQVYLLLDRSCREHRSHL